MESIMAETNGSPLKMLPGGPHVQGRMGLLQRVFPEIGVAQNGWFIMENLIKIDDLETHI